MFFSELSLHQKTVFRNIFYSSIRIFELKAYLTWFYFHEVYVLKKNLFFQLNWWPENGIIPSIVWLNHTIDFRLRSRSKPKLSNNLKKCKLSKTILLSNWVMEKAGYILFLGKINIFLAANFGTEVLLQNIYFKLIRHCISMLCLDSDWHTHILWTIHVWQTEFKHNLTLRSLYILKPSEISSQIN